MSPESPAPALLGLILAGGRATRLGGGDKGLLQIGGRTMLARIVERVAPQCGGLLLSANGPPARFPGWAGPLVADHPDDLGQGPLAGLLAGLDWAASHRPLADAVLTVPSDTPFLPRDLVQRLAEAREGSRAAIAFARSAGRDHPLAALWPIDFRQGLRTALRADGRRRVRDVLQDQATVAVEWPAEPFDPFFNVNTPADVETAERWAAQMVLSPACGGKK